VRVAEAAVEVAGRLEWGGVKPYEARTVRLPRSVADELGAYLADRPREPEDLVFTAKMGGPIRLSKWVPGYFKPALVRAGLDPATRWYDLRHTCASLLIARDGSIKAVQAQLGHATASITLNVYGHLFPDELGRLAEGLDETRRQALATPSRPTGTVNVVQIGKRAGQ
jgi:integrase